MHHWEKIQSVVFSSQDEYSTQLQQYYCHYLTSIRNSGRLKEILLKQSFRYLLDHLPVELMIAALNADDWNSLLSAEFAKNICNSNYISMLLKNNSSFLNPANSLNVIKHVLTSLFVDGRFGNLNSSESMYLLKKTLDPRQLSKVREMKDMVPAYNHRFLGMFNELINQLEERLQLYQLVFK